MAQTFKHLLRSMRPKQWVKNLFVFAALVFAKEFTDGEKVGLAAAAFVLFCLASGAVYIMNDVVDAPDDRKHPQKRRRPIASGLVPAYQATVVSAALAAAALVTSFYLGALFGAALLGYVLLQLLYSFFLKHVVILDVFSIAAGFVLRVAAGAAIIAVPVSAWVILCTFFLTLFLAVNRRRTELAAAAKDAASDGATRSVLAAYPRGLLEQMNAVALSATIIAYAFYTFSSEHSRLLMLTIPFVLYGLLYYVFVLEREPSWEGGSEEIFFREWPLQITIALWIIASAVILVVFG